MQCPCFILLNKGNSSTAINQVILFKNGVYFLNNYNILNPTKRGSGLSRELLCEGLTVKEHEEAFNILLVYINFTNIFWCKETN